MAGRFDPEVAREPGHHHGGGDPRAGQHICHREQFGVSGCVQKDHDGHGQPQHSAGRNQGPFAAAFSQPW